MRTLPLVLAAALGSSPLAGCACGSSESEQTTTLRDNGTFLSATGDELGDVVAEVSGVPIYAACVARQAAARAISRQAALDECIGFELLAQEAQRRGLDEHRAVIEATATESVRRYIDEAFIARYPDPDGTDRALLQKLYDKARPRIYYKPLYRHTVHVRAPVSGKEEGSPKDLAARALAEEIHAALADKRELSNADFYSLAQEVAGERTLEKGDPFSFPRRPEDYHRGAVEPFAAAAFAIPEVGMVSAPARTKWGWDIILLTRIEPRLDKSLEEVKHELFAIVRRQEWLKWSKQHGRGVRVEIALEALETLQSAEDTRRFGPPSGPPSGPPIGPPVAPADGEVPQ